MRGSPVEISPAGADRLDALVPVFARAFVDDPMMRWSLLGSQEPEETLTRCFAAFLESALELGLVWEARAAHGAAVWIPPGSAAGWDEHPWSQPRILDLADDGGLRYESFWEWIDEHTQDQGRWLLDSIAVDPPVQGQGYGRALIDAGLGRAAAGGCGAVLSTGTERNLPIYQQCGFRVVDHAAAPDGGPHIWFMRSDP